MDHWIFSRFEHARSSTCRRRKLSRRSHREIRRKNQPKPPETPRPLWDTHAFFRWIRLGETSASKPKKFCQPTNRRNLNLNRRSSRKFRSRTRTRSPSQPVGTRLNSISLCAKYDVYKYCADGFQLATNPPARWWRSSREFFTSSTWRSVPTQWPNFTFWTNCLRLGLWNKHFMENFRKINQHRVCCN